MSDDWSFAMDGEAETTPLAPRAPLAEVVNPQPKGLVARPAANPQELQQRLQGWEGFLQKLQTDPTMQEAAFHVATRLTQGRKPGQSVMGGLGAALGSGQEYLRMLNEKKAASQRQAVLDQAKLSESAAQVEASKAGTARTKQQTDQAAELFPQTKAKLEQEIKSAVTTEELKAAQLKKALFETDPERLARHEGLDIERTKAQTEQARAGAARSWAGADSERADAGMKRLKAQITQEAYDAMTDEEKKAAGSQALTGSKTARNTLMENMDAYGAMYQKSTEGQQRPGETPEAYKQRVNDFAIAAVKKVQSDPKLTAAYKVLESMDSLEEDQQAAMNYIRAALAPSGGGGQQGTATRVVRDQKTGKLVIQQ